MSAKIRKSALIGRLAKFTNLLTFHPRHNRPIAQIRAVAIGCVEPLLVFIETQHAADVANGWPKDGIEEWHALTKLHGLIDPTTHLAQISRVNLPNIFFTIL